MSEGCCRIEKAVNGYTVCLQDPEIRKSNAKPNSKWRDPSREYVFRTVKEVMAFLEKNLDKALVADEYSSSFDTAAATPMKD